MSRRHELLTGFGAKHRWNHHAEPGEPTVVTYSFGESKPPYHFGVPYRNPADWSGAHKRHVREALKTWEETSALTFVEVPDEFLGDIRFSMIDLSGMKNAVGRQVSGIGYYPHKRKIFDESGEIDISSRDDVSGDIFLHRAYYGRDSGELAPGQRGYSIVLHEIGHALGLKHPFEGRPRIPYREADGDLSVMSYERDTSATELGGADVAAMKVLYGPAWKSPKAFWDAETDRLHVFGDKFANRIAGSAKDEVVEARGRSDWVFAMGGRDEVDGGPGDDALLLGDGGDAGRGGRGDDTLRGGAGNDRLDGGRGADRLFGDDGRDKFLFRRKDGEDEIRGFEPGRDKIRFLSGSKDFDDLEIGQQGRHAVIEHGRGGEIVLRGVKMADLDEGDFLFG